MGNDRYVLSEEADLDLETVFEYIHAKFGFKAVDYLTEIEDVCDKLAITPTVGRIRNEIKNGLQSFPTNDHIIFLQNHDRPHTNC